ncbi:MFS general substrate transporter [Calocera viscosa TUFC12733]|uniref:MFS general substrate transporter n=1 Tax=Calocera viscosa (strain TUFC12733) TaxID=1330018 RepID=A0A167GRZ1_CALVF|nr:MFS general substrate transporter [Calocera viscosa TUFC12733]
MAGLNDGSIGTLLPYLIETYNISTSFMGIMYATSFAGWALMAVIMLFTVAGLGRKGALVIGAIFYAISQVLRIWTPPFPLYAVTFFLASLGQAYQDVQANVFVSEIKASHLYLGLIHAIYSLGLLVAPLIGNTIASQAPGQWPYYYTVPFGIALLNITLVLAAFFDKEDYREIRRLSQFGKPEASQFTETRSRRSTEGSSTFKETIQEMKETLSYRAVWQLSLFYFFYLGASAAVGGWTVLFLTKSAGYVPTGTFLGSFLARLLMAHLTHTWLGGEHWMLMIYCTINLALQLVAWLVNNVIATSVAVSVMGFFFGPFFASGMQIRGNALAFILVVAQLGASIFPAVTGVVASSKGVIVLQPIAVALIVLTAISWWFVPTALREKPGDGVMD